MTSSKFIHLPARELKKGLKSVIKKANEDQLSLMKKYKESQLSKRAKF